MHFTEQMPHGTTAAKTRPRRKAKGERQTAPAVAAPAPTRSYRVVVDEKALILAVLVPADLGSDRTNIACQHILCRGKYVSSERLAKHWGLGVVYGVPDWIEPMEALGNPPLPRSHVLAFL